MQIKNTPQRYGAVAILLHWLIALLVISLLALGLYMAGLAISPQKLKLYGWHKEWGILVLGLVILRILWRWLNLVPLLPATLPGWQKWAAHAVHWAFYVFLFAMPLTGWLMSSASDLPVSFFGWLTLPDLIGPNKQFAALLRDLHEWLGYGLIATICLHTGAALQHHFINKDDILRRMLP